MSHDRTGGSRGNAGVNPPVAHFSTQFTPKSDPPAPFDMHDLRFHASKKGFRDGDTPQADYFLNRISYQHASGYFKLFENDAGNIEDGSSMRELHRVVLFDRKLQALLMEYIGLFELQFRAQYSYRLSSERGAFAHRNPKNFKNPAFFDSFLASYEGEFNRQIRSRNADILRAFEEYGDAPTWLAVEVMSFGTLSKLYSNTRSKSVREEVAASFGTTTEHLESWLRAISGVRNQCAHFGQLCGRKLVSKPKRIPGADGDNSTPFYIILILLKLIGCSIAFTDDPDLSYGVMMIESVVDLFDRHLDVLRRCGIPDDWKELLAQESVTETKVAFKEESGGSPLRGKRTWVSVFTNAGRDVSFTG